MTHSVNISPDATTSNAAPATRDYDLAGLGSGRTLRHFLALRHLLLGRKEFAGGAGWLTPFRLWLAHRCGCLSARPRHWAARLAAPLGRLARAARRGSPAKP